MNLQEIFKSDPSLAKFYRIFKEVFTPPGPTGFKLVSAGVYELNFSNEYEKAFKNLNLSSNITLNISGMPDESVATIFIKKTTASPTIITVPTNSIVSPDDTTWDGSSFTLSGAIDTYWKLTVQKHTDGDNILYWWTNLGIAE